MFVKPNFMFESTQSNMIGAKNRNYFIYVGRLDELKGIRILFEAWKNMGTSAPKLLVCGTGPLENWCKSFVQAAPECNIELKGFVSNIEAKQLISKAKALLLPTQWYEGFPMTIVEAYSVGTPVIGSDMGNVGSLIQDGITGWKFTHDSAEALSTVVREADRAGFIIDKTKAERYSMDSNYQQLMKIYEEVLG